MRYETITLDVAQGIATITLNRPEAYNALSLTLGRELFGAVLEVDEDPAVRCVVLTGAGKAFCGGGDVKEFTQSLPRIGILIKELTTFIHGVVSRLVRTPKPVITAVNGVAAGGGLALALAGDLVVAAESARFTMAYSRIAATPDGSSTYWLPRLCGIRRAMELFYTNRVLTAKEAVEWGSRRGPSPTRSFPARCGPWPRSSPRGRPWRSGGASGFSTSRRPRASRPRWSTRARRSRRAATARTSPRGSARSRRSARPSFAVGDGAARLALRGRSSYRGAQASNVSMNRRSR